MNPRRLINFFRSPTGALILFLLGLLFILLMVNSRRPFDSKRQLTAAKPGANAPQLPETVRRDMIPLTGLLTIVPVGDSTTAVAALKNGLVDANMSVQPTQIVAIAGLKIAKAVLDTESGDGPAILIRIPDQENASVGPRYFESMQLDGIVYPAPFTPIPEIIASGWQPRLFKQTQIPDDQRAQLEQWAQNAARK